MNDKKTHKKLYDPATTAQRRRMAGNASGGGSKDRPAPLTIVAGEDNHDRWTTFKEAWEDFSLLNGIYALEPDMQVANFRVALGEENRVLLKNLGLGTVVKDDKACAKEFAPCKSLAQIITALDCRFARHQNTIHRRFIYRRAMQASGETVADFFDRIVRLARSCRFDAATAETQIRDQLVLGTSLTEARAAIFRESGDVGLERVLATLKLYEENKKALSEIESAGARENVMAVKQQNKENKSRKSKQDCRYCGQKHEARKCPAYGQSCKKCGKKNHFESVCRTGERANQINDETVTEEETKHSSEEELAWSAAMENGKTKKRFFVSFKTGRDGILAAQVDTGATCNCIGKKAFLRMRNLGAADELRTKRQARIKMYDGSVARSLGSCIGQVRGHPVGPVGRRNWSGEVLQRC